MSKTAFEPALQKLKGLRSTRATAKKAAVEGGMPACPAHLNADSRRVWRRAVAILAARGTLSPGDATALAIFSTTYARWVAALADVETNGMQISVVSVGRHGEAFERIKLNPCLAVAQESEKRLLALARELGLTPLMRERILPAKRKAEARLPTPGSAADLFPELFVVKPETESKDENESRQ